MTWLIIVSIAYFLNATSTAINKFLIEKRVPKPTVYTFWVSCLSLFGLILIPFGFRFYSTVQIIIAILTGGIFTLAILYMFKALAKNEATRITTFMGGLQPIFIIILAWLFLNETLNPFALLGVVIIIFGTIIISWQENWPNILGQSAKKSYFLAIISTALFAIFYTLSKYVFNNQDFISGFVWMRIGGFASALLFLLNTKSRHSIIRELKPSKQKNTKPLFILSQAAGALSLVLVSYAIAISESVAIVNALRGMEYIFLLLIMIFLSPTKIKIEKFTKASLAQKILATAIIALGIFIITIN